MLVVSSFTSTFAASRAVAACFLSFAFSRASMRMDCSLPEFESGSVLCGSIYGPSRLPLLLIISFGSPHSIPTLSSSSLSSLWSPDHRPSILGAPPSSALTLTVLSAVQVCLSAAKVLTDSLNILSSITEHQHLCLLDLSPSMRGKLWSCPLPRCRRSRRRRCSLRGCQRVPVDGARSTKQKPSTSSFGPHHSRTIPSSAAAPPPTTPPSSSSLLSNPLFPASPSSGAVVTSIRASYAKVVQASPPPGSASLKTASQPPPPAAAPPAQASVPLPVSSREGNPSQASCPVPPSRATSPPAAATCTFVGPPPLITPIQASIPLLQVSSPSPVEGKLVALPTPSMKPHSSVLPALRATIYPSDAPLRLFERKAKEKNGSNSRIGKLLLALC